MTRKHRDLNEIRPTSNLQQSKDKLYNALVDDDGVLRNEKINKAIKLAIFNYQLTTLNLEPAHRAILAMTLTRTLLCQLKPFIKKNLLL